jgi:hypothetical protein
MRVPTDAAGRVFEALMADDTASGRAPVTAWRLGANEEMGFAFSLPGNVEEVVRARLDGLPDVIAVDVDVREGEEPWPVPGP